MMPWDSPENDQEHRPQRPAGYVLHEDGSTDRPFLTMMAARAAGEEAAQAAGLVSEGWRQEHPRLWVLLPHRRYSVEMR